MNLLTLDTVTCLRGGRRLFEALDLVLEAGGAAVVTGPNGAGKSSLLRLVAGLLRAEAGTVRAAPAALLDERSALDPDRRLADALGFWARVDGTHDRIAAALAMLDLTALADVPVRLLSTGQRRRAGLARIAASPAPLWLLDEPANGLDTAAVVRLAAMIAAHRAGGGAALIATHLPLDLPGARTIALEPALEATA
ncbi:heme ABC exporter ATP-binding protein CcmA [Sphingomonas sp. KR1UV-12]|uniref:Heme ABC exporter ATP-binding protein CcmA n=1 Tax=Sphingomonas aurea TaxID=3063994 RepID=A0ABT9ENK0_9SPHN|nr:heme ABC exporter ATP-binding protein CcmA [Sphingomonas sp. KR1UV-12]MDP1028527.1 heme ABC exporter ATP-binding protein CcmA [Sphingomonas sp. KR1UV-12]